MKVLYIPIPGGLRPWYDDFVAAAGDRHEIRLFDHQGPLERQFEEVGAVVARGGKTGTRSMFDAAAHAGARLWQITGAGLDGLDIPYVLGKGLMLAHTPGPFSGIALAEHAMFMMLWFAKKYHECQADVRGGRFYQLTTEELHEATLGVVGLGASGRELAYRATAFGMRVVATDELDVSAAVLRKCGVSSCGKPADLDGLLSESDYVSLHVPLTEETNNMIGRRELKLMKPTAILINVARGGLIDEPALVDALTNQRLRGAGLDAFSREPIAADDPLLGLDNVLATPHNAGGSHGTSRRRGEVAAENVDRVARGLPPLYQITL